MALSPTVPVGNSSARRFSPLLRRLAEWFPELLLLVFTTGAAIWGRGRWIDPLGDAGTWWSAAYRLANGEVLYRDVYLQFGPLSPYLLALGAKIFAASTTYMGVVSWISAIGATLLLLRAARSFLSTLERLALLGLVLAISVFAPGPARLVFPYAPGAVHALLLSFGALVLVREGSARFETRAWVAGLFAGLAFCAKQEIGLACLVALIVGGVVRRQRVDGWIVKTVLGFGGPVILATIVALSSSSMESLREESRLWPLAPAPPRSWLHLYRLVAGLSIVDWPDVVLVSLWRLLLYLAPFAVAALLLARERRASRWIPTLVLLFGLFLFWAWTGFDRGRDFHPISLSMAIAFVVSAAAVVAPRLPERASLAAFGCFAGLLAARTAVSTQLSGAYSGVAHFASALTWVAFLCVVAPRIVVGNERAVAWMRRLVGVTLMVVSWIGAFGGVRALAEEGKERIETRQGNVFVDTALAPVLRAVARTVKPGERIWVLPEINAVDALFLARSVSPYPSQMPGWLDATAEAKLLERMEANPPTAVVLFSRPTPEYGVKRFGEGYARLLAAWVARNYSPLETMPTGTILRRRVATPPRAAAIPRGEGLVGRVR